MEQPRGVQRRLIVNQRLSLPTCCRCTAASLCSGPLTHHTASTDLVSHYLYAFACEISHHHSISILRHPSIKAMFARLAVKPKIVNKEAHKYHTSVCRYSASWMERHLISTPKSFPTARLQLPTCLAAKCRTKTTLKVDSLLVPAIRLSTWQRRQFQD